MTFLLSSANVFQYLVDVGLYASLDLGPEQVEPVCPEIEARSYKNFNLVVRIDAAHQFIVKQERHDLDGETGGDFWFEWRVQEFIEAYPELQALRCLVSEVQHFDADRAILAARFFPNYLDLGDFYDGFYACPREADVEGMGEAIATALGQTIAQIHRLTFQNPSYGVFLSRLGNGKQLSQQNEFLERIDRLGPCVFSLFPQESLQFFQLYQKDPQVAQAVGHLRSTWRKDCLIHRDLRLSNVLLDRRWLDRRGVTQRAEYELAVGDGEETIAKVEAESPLRLIDWEKFAWGDPAYDLGTAIAAHLQLWLKSLALHAEIDLPTALRLANVPLEVVQPSLLGLIRGYLDDVPEIVGRHPDFLVRALQFAGGVLIEKVLVKLEYRRPFENADICAMQVARVLLVRPHDGAQQILGMSLAEIGESSQSQADPFRASQAQASQTRASESVVR